MADWHSIEQRSQHLVRGLAALGHRCAYLSPHLGREFSQPYPFSPRRLVTLIGPGVLELHIHLLREPVFHQRRLRDEEAETISAGIRSLFEVTHSASQVIIASFPLWVDVARRLETGRKIPIIYDCHDLLEGFSEIDDGLILAERELLRIADLVVFSAESLAREHIARCPDLAGKSLVLRNAVNPAHFDSVFQRSIPKKARKTVGYFGSLNTWFNVDTLASAAREHPEWRFLLVGPRARNFPQQTFAGLANVELIGEVPYGDAPAWLSEFDVATIPFVVSPLTMATNPVKLYEYFACGLPVVSSRLGEVERYSELAYLADTPREFISQLEAAMDEDNEGKRLERRRVAERETWAERCEVLTREISRLGRAV
jgi:glycosyltransferase involved in cell wall biosynthesis